MPTQVLMPALSPTMEEGKLAKWVVKEGDTISSGDVIAEIETDKATMEVEAVDEGRIGKILVSEGTEGVKVNTPIAVILAEGEDAGAASSFEAPLRSAPQDEAAKPGSTSPHPQVPPKAASKGDGATVAPGPTPEPGDDEGGKKARGPDGGPVSALHALPTAEPEEDSPEVPEGAEMVDMTVREALRDAMAEEMRRSDDVFIMGEEVAEYQGAYKITQGLLDEFGPRRVIDTPITEHGFAGLGVGAAYAGLRPIVEFMTWNFAMQAVDHIINSAAKTLYMAGGQMGCPIVFRGPNGAAARVAAQHSQDYAAWYSNVPGLKVIMPHTAADFKGLLKAAIRDPNPVVFLENEILYGQTFKVPKLDDFVLPIGKAKIARKGKDATIVSFGIGMTYALKAAEALAGEGIDCEVIDLRTIRPMDIDAVIRSVQKTGRCVTVEEGWPQSSVGSHISAQLMQKAFDHLDAPVININGKDVPMPYAANLEKLALPSVKEVVEAVKAVSYAA